MVGGPKPPLAIFLCRSSLIGLGHWFPLISGEPSRAAFTRLHKAGPVLSGRKSRVLDGRVLARPQPSEPPVRKVFVIVEGKGTPTPC